MPDAYGQLLDLTIRHLEQLQARGVRYVPVCSSTLAALHQPPKLGPTQMPTGGDRRQFRAQRTATAVTGFLNQAGGQAQLGSEPSLPAIAPGRQAQPPAAPTKAEAMAALRAQVCACVKCPHLAATRRNVVFGVGDINARLMFVGEAPGVEEDQQGEPFVGPAGQLLTKIIQAMGLTRDRVYIANVLKCRPDTPNQAYGNRPPTAEEMRTCLPYLLEQIQLVNPEVIVALGATAVRGLLGEVSSISRLRGQWCQFHGWPVMPTFHPSYLLRAEAASIQRKRQVWEDMLQVMERLGLPISAKQRNYFLSASTAAVAS
jgi:uracil-DNA glycosylase family 4